MRRLISGGNEADTNTKGEHMKRQTLRARATRLLAQSRYTLETSPAIALLVNFAAQNAGLEAGNYYDFRDPNKQAVRDGRRAYATEARNISAQWRKFVELFHIAAAEGVTDADVIEESKRAFSGRLTWLPKQHHDAKTGNYSGAWEYTTGQYFPTEYRNAANAVLDYAIRRVRGARPKTKQTVTTIAELKALNERNGGCWFGRGEMRFFGTRIESGILCGRYFITSEQPPHGSRKFSVRTFDDEGSVETVGEFCELATKRDALAALREHLANAEPVAA